jgi:uncharacterized ferredoxin-like protein
MIYNNIEAEKSAAFTVAELMLAAARTAPKGCGADNLAAIIIDGEEKARLADQMRKIARETGEDFFARDGGNVDASAVIVILGARNNPLGLTHCGYCGFEDCTEMLKAGANCAFNVTDLGIAVGSAVSVAADHRIDSRVMFSAGKAAIALKYLPDDVRVAYGIPLSASSKSVFFDRSPENVML